MAHVMAYAVQKIFDDVKLGTGLVVEDGFYYDFALPRSIVPQDLALIQSKMIEILHGGHDVVSQSIEIDSARGIFSNRPYKIELLDNLPSNIMVYKINEFID